MKTIEMKDEIIEYMELHNNDEVGIYNSWDYEDAEYHYILEYQIDCIRCLDEMRIADPNGNFYNDDGMMPCPDCQGG